MENQNQTLEKNAAASELKSSSVSLPPLSHSLSSSLSSLSLPPLSRNTHNNNNTATDAIINTKFLQQAQYGSEDENDQDDTNTEDGDESHGEQTTNTEEDETGVFIAKETREPKLGSKRVHSLLEAAGIFESDAKSTLIENNGGQEDHVEGRDGETRQEKKIARLDSEKNNVSPNKVRSLFLSIFFAFSHLVSVSFSPPLSHLVSISFSPPLSDFLYLSLQFPTLIF
jgi:hypothetical protein